MTGKATSTSACTLKPEEPSVSELLSSPAHSTEIPSAIPLLLDLPFEGTHSLGHSFSESLVSCSQEKTDHSLSGSFGECHGKRTQVNSPEVRVKI